MKVVDASVGFKWIVPEQDSDKALALLSDDLHAPDLFPIEITNALLIAERRGRITAGLTGVFAADLMLKLPTLHSSVPLLPRALELAQQYRRTVYDCLYIALAEREGCDLVTADQRLVSSVNLPHLTILS